MQFKLLGLIFFNALALSLNPQREVKINYLKQTTKDSTCITNFGNNKKELLSDKENF